MDNISQLILRSQQGDEEARSMLVTENIGLVWCVVKRFLGRGVESEDLFQIGSIGLLKAIDKFNLEYEVKFSTYAVPLIAGEIKRFLRDDGMIKVSRSLKELAYRAVNAKEQLTKRLNREPTMNEIAEFLEVSKEELQLALESGYEVESLQKANGKGDGQEIPLLEKIISKEDTEETITNKLLLQELLGTLKKEERQVIYLRYFSNYTQTQVGKKLGISQVQVSRMEKRILKQMRENCEK